MRDDIQQIRINTAGAYVRVRDRYVFALGIRPHDGNIPVVRLGGHREGNETGWQCAVREVYEESNLHIEPLLPQTTYVCDWDRVDTEPQRTKWQPTAELEPAPLLVVRYGSGKKMHLSLMYLARANESPMPSSEIRGLLVLREDEIHRLCSEPLTLQQYLDGGGEAIMNANFDMSLVLEPFTQLRLLSRILRLPAGAQTG